MTRREKIKILTNVAHVFELEDPRGAETTSRFHEGVEYRFNVLSQGEPCMVYLPVDGQLAITRAKVQAGDEIEIMKRVSNGCTSWCVRRMSDASEPAAVAPFMPQTRVIAPAVAAPAPAPAAPVLGYATTPARVHPMLELMTRCLEVGYYANQTAWSNLRAAGIEIDAPIWDDVRATGISLFIERSRNGGSR